MVVASVFPPSDVTVTELVPAVPLDTALPKLLPEEEDVFRSVSGSTDGI